MVIQKSELVQSVRLQLARCLEMGLDRRDRKSQGVKDALSFSEQVEEAIRKIPKSVGVGFNNIPALLVIGHSTVSFPDQVKSLKIGDELVYTHCRDEQFCDPTLGQATICRPTEVVYDVSLNGALDSRGEYNKFGLAEGVALMRLPEAPKMLDGNRIELAGTRYSDSVFAVYRRGTQYILSSVSHFGTPENVLEPGYKMAA